MKTTEFILLSIFVLFLAILTFMKNLFPDGNKDVRGESRWATEFNQVSSYGDFKVNIKQGDNFKVEVWAESNLLPYVETKVEDHTLKIKTRGFRSLMQHTPVEILITTPRLDGLFLSGSGMINTGTFKSKQFRAIISGSGDIYTKVITDQLNGMISGSGNLFLEGNAKAGSFLISGSGKIKSFQAEQRNCEAVIVGSGNIFLNSLESLRARISGSGKILYINHPTINKSIFGSGEVLNMNTEQGMMTEDLGKDMKMRSLR